ncbi:BNR repeat protein [Anseongella ginsenosidimutans]|uniref:BNR repeat protein n=2 Tax=Anseongella ginsenosidimutans TaxID=496056 RepID=A0A4R3KT81_9SPHI|nr:exo-alpha-sialidase [Anseongella ginsenosidimutans]TCS88456.1 BNR repeat protein [Anseongella ginsenosidimutans]
MSFSRAFILLLVVLAFFSCKTRHALHSGMERLKEKELVLRIAPKAGNPRNSEGSFITLKDGRILFVYSKYSGEGSGDHDPAFLAGRYSADGGKTWTKEDEVIVENEGLMNVMSVSLLRLQNGAIAMFYLRKNSTSDCIPVMRISTDEAETWSRPVTCITDKKGYFVLNNDRVIQLSSGRLLMAVALHKTPDTKWKEKAQLWSYFSDDNGKTWQAGSPVPTPDTIVTQEPGVVELKNGNILMFIRASAGKQLYSWSADQGATWSPAVPSPVSSPLSPASIERIPETNDLLMVWNNNDGETAATKGERTPLTLAISKDEGKSWRHIKPVETDPDGWYCYTAIHFTEDAVLFGYCAGSQSAGTHLSVTNISKIELDWIYQQ